MTKNDWYEAGDQIKRIVQDAVDTGDFSQIGGAISDVVNDTLDGLLGNGNYPGGGRSNGQTFDSYDQTNGGYGQTYDSHDQMNGGYGQTYDSYDQTYQDVEGGGYSTGGQTYQSSGSGGYGSDGTYRGTSERIRRAYEQAESKGSQAYERATERVHRQAGNQSAQRSGTWSGQRSQTSGSWGNQNGQASGAWGNRKGQNSQTSSGMHQPVPSRGKVPGEFGSKVMKYIGFGLGAIFGASFGLAVMAAFATGGFFLLWDSAGSVGFLCICSLLLGMSGEHRLGISRRFHRYQEVIGARTYCMIEELASGIGETTKYVRKDLKKMIRRGYFPVGYLDRKETLLITDQSTYQQYLKTEEEYEKRQNEQAASEAAKAKKAKNVQSVKNTQNADRTATAHGASGGAGAQTASASSAAKTGTAKGEGADASKTMSEEEKPERSPEHQALIDEGWKYIRHIRDCNDRLPDAEITAKLNRLELVVTRIFREAEKNPDAVSDLRKMMSYYLPTTRKLLDAYCDLDNQPIRGENIENTRREIENALDTINTAFENLLNDLFEEQAWDISSDISVLNAMLAQEGLTGNDFGKKDTAANSTESKNL